MSKHLSRISGMRRDQTVTTKFTNPTTILDPVQISLKPHKSCTRCLHRFWWGFPLHLGRRQTHAYEAQNTASSLPRMPMGVPAPPLTTKYSNPTTILNSVQISLKPHNSPHQMPSPIPMGVPSPDLPFSPFYWGSNVHVLPTCTI